LATWAKNSDPNHPLDPMRDGENFIEIVRDVETTVIQVPAGMQDYYGAMFGGLQSLRWGAGTHHREWLPESLLGELDQRLLLFYSGQSRNSGINNWTLFKSFIDRQEDIRVKFEKISAATRRLEKALLNRDWSDVGDAIAEEWAVRKTLAKGITTSEIDSAFSEAQKIAPISGKICGAGGGGCFFVYLPEPNPDLKSRILEIFSERKIRHLPFHSVRRGLEVHVKRS
jgi:D-glycero-alpha-D-manno-heptose-7-phosphate kinase